MVSVYLVSFGPDLSRIPYASLVTSCSTLSNYTVITEADVDF